MKNLCVFFCLVLGSIPLCWAQWKEIAAEQSNLGLIRYFHDNNGEISQIEIDLSTAGYDDIKNKIWIDTSSMNRIIVYYNYTTNGSERWMTAVRSEDELKVWILDGLSYIENSRGERHIKIFSNGWEVP